MELVGWFDVFGQVDDGVLEGEQRPGIDFQGQVEIERSPAAFFRVKIDLPDLAQGIGLNEVPLVVDVETVIHRMVLQVSHVSGDVDDGHNC